MGNRRTFLKTTVGVVGVGVVGLEALPRIVGASIGGKGIGGKRRLAGDPVFEQVLQEMGRVQKDIDANGMRASHVRSQAGHFRLLAMAAATNGMDAMVKEAALSARPHAMAFSLDEVRSHLQARGLEHMLDATPIQLPAFTHADLQRAQLQLAAEGLSPHFARTSVMFDGFANQLAIQVGELNQAHIIHVQQNNPPNPPSPVQVACQHARDLANTAWQVAAVACALIATVVAAPEAAAACLGATIAAVGFEISAAYTCAGVRM
jgi:hypothetical protein